MYTIENLFAFRLLFTFVIFELLSYILLRSKIEFLVMEELTYYVNILNLLYSHLYLLTNKQKQWNSTFVCTSKSFLGYQINK